jgi:hypothetical protein
MPGKHHHVVTDFSQYSLAQLQGMLSQSDPATCQNAAETWGSAGQLLAEQAQNLQAQLSSIDSGWVGSAAKDYKKMMADLADGIQKVAGTAFTMRDVMFNASDALTTAQTQMAAIADIPAATPDALTLGTAPASSSHILSPVAIAAADQQQATAQQAVAAATTSQAKAAAVMNALANSYVTAQAGIPPSPAASVPAVPGTSASGTAASGASASGGVSGTSLTNPASGVLAPTTLAPASGLSSSLFGDMFTVGLAAAAAASAAFGGLTSLLPSSPKSAGAQSGKIAPAGSGRPALGAAAAGAAGGAMAAPALSSSLGSADAAQAAGLAAGNVGAAASGAPMMPPMAMGGMGAPGMGDAGSKGRIPSWLVEHQDVWGTSIPASPGLIDD